ncbi:chemotaxis protein CheX [Paenibacillus sp. WQ 127069]|uniref:Chemotaxis protein CheX n=1 Tax=Paenibacillus baimaensis TaxID=2982185 RepID=A0ABT2UA21_9BACL|nr:chemotaxis protein CheX [Paenibacillus sp. WQ 127069]MCU6791492.1 chemotaxis protein CheX [Paenibacillus sp. WQ 127069]
MNHEEQYFQAFMAKSAAYITGLGISGLRELEDDEEGLYLEDVTAFIQLSGVIQGGVILTVDHGLAGALAHKFMLEDITEEEAAQYGVEVVAEIANVISGNALTDRDEHDIFLGAPLVIVTKKAELRSKFSNFFVKRFQTDSGNFYCIYIPSQNKSELARILAI